MTKEIPLIATYDVSELQEKILLNRFLIKPSCKETFDYLYCKHYQCILCKDIIFDPVYCSDCQAVYCRVCAEDKVLNVKNNIYLKCDHLNINNLPDNYINLFKKYRARLLLSMSYTGYKFI